MQGASQRLQLSSTPLGMVLCTPANMRIELKIPSPAGDPAKAGHGANRRARKPTT